MSDTTSTLTTCPDPQCGQPLACSAECVCPMCWMPREDAPYQGHSMAAWLLYSPVMRALTAEGVEWLWGTNRKPNAAPTHDLEIEFDHNASITVTLSGGQYLADLHCQVFAGSRIDPPAWDCVDGMRTDSLDDLVAWVCKTIATVRRED